MGENFETSFETCYIRASLGNVFIYAFTPHHSSIKTCKVRQRFNVGVSNFPFLMKMKPAFLLTSCYRKRGGLHRHTSRYLIWIPTSYFGEISDGKYELLLGDTTINLLGSISITQTRAEWNTRAEKIPCEKWSEKISLISPRSLMIDRKYEMQRGNGRQV